MKPLCQLQWWMLPYKCSHQCSKHQLCPLLHAPKPKSAYASIYHDITLMTTLTMSKLTVYCEKWTAMTGCSVAGIPHWHVLSLSVLAASQTQPHPLSSPAHMKKLFISASQRWKIDHPNYSSNNIESQEEKQMTSPSLKLTEQQIQHLFPAVIPARVPNKTCENEPHQYHGSQCHWVKE
jgi:hypothetical protein